MKVFTYYLKPTKEDLRRGMKEYRLHSITNDKDIMKRFEDERDMNKFIKNVHKMDKDEWQDYLDNNQAYALEDKMLRTKKVDNAGLYYEDFVNVLSNDNEIMYCGDAFAPLPMLDINYWNMHYRDVAKAINLKPKIKEALEELEFFRTAKIILGESRFDPFGNDYDAPDVEPDELSIFIMLYGDTFK